jgi:spermidine synthase
MAVYAIFAVSGATALVYEVIWARWLGLVFGNTTLAVSMVLGAFMAGLAVGS